MYDDDDENEYSVGAAKPRPKAPPQDWARAGNPMPPWHMWGNSQIVRTTMTGGIFTGGTASTIQLAKMQYRRPETWRFVFFSRLIEATAIAQGENIIVDFDVTVGVGRTSFTLGPNVTPTPGLMFSQPQRTRGFCRHWYVSGVAPLFLFGELYKWTTNGLSPPVDDQDAFTPRATDLLTAQDIQVKARVGAVSEAGSNNPVVVEVGCFFAPNAHVRPDWFNDANQFLGGETGGT
jgi:hypothetical protein